ncbi:MAG TPA: chemotaxis protein CheW [Gemmatimonadales bacterium]|nr:chemotaxis protein CheW [Gemmatimonadales bacterium]
MTDGSLVSARLLVFRVGTLVCAAEVDQVREILPRLPTTRIPGAPPVVAGLVNVRGTLVTVVEGWRALGAGGGRSQPQPGLPDATPPETSQTAPPPPDAPEVAGSTLIFELEPGGEAGEKGNGKKLIGFTVDEVTDMVAVGDTTLEDRGGLPGVDPTLVRAVGRRNGEKGVGSRLFIVLDVAALLGPILTT